MAVVITSFCLIVMIAFLSMALMTNDVIISRLFASFAIIAGAFAFRNLSTQNQVNNE